MFLVDEERPARTFNKDDLPAPLGPRIAQTLPVGTYSKITLKS